MDTVPLSTTGNSQSQSNTNSPQSNVQSINTGTRTDNVQPATPSTLLNGQSGVNLNNPGLSISLSSGGGPVAAATGTAPAVHSAPKHHLNPVLLGLPVVLVIVAAGLIWSINRSAQKASV